MTGPLVTLLLPIHNAAAFLRQSIPALLGQTLSDFELLAIDDGSTDASGEILRRWRDPRIRVVHNGENLGVARSLNRGIALSRGEFIARVDADDISHRRRLELQAAFLQDHPDVGLVGSWVRLFGDQPGVVERRPCGNHVIRAFSLFDNPLFHPTVMLRRSMLVDHDLRYDPAFSRSEDYELWLRAGRLAGLENLPRALVRMRVHRGNVTATARREMDRQAENLMGRQLAGIGLHPDGEALSFHRLVGQGGPLGSRDAVLQAQRWLAQVAAAAVDSGLHRPEAAAEAAGRVWFRLCRNCTHLGWWILMRWIGSPQIGRGRVFPDEFLRFLLGVLRHASSIARRGRG